jgi:hypothetical protein
VLIATLPELGLSGFVQKTGKLILGVFVKIPFRKSDDLGAVPVVETDPYPVGGRVSGDLQKPDPGRVKYLPDMIAYLVYLALSAHFSASIHIVN